MRKKEEQEACDTPPVKRQRKKRSAKVELQQNQRIRTRFVLQDSEPHEPGNKEPNFYPCIVAFNVVGSRAGLSGSFSLMINKHVALS